MFRLLVIMFFGVAFSATLFAQELAPVADPLAWFTSVTGVVAGTAFIVAILKRALANVSGLNAVPTWVYAVAVAFGLTLVGGFITKTLPGSVWQNAAQAVIWAASASGIYEWVKPENRMKGPRDSGKSQSQGPQDE